MSVKVHEAYCLDSSQDRLLWFDDFLGDQVQDEWRVAGTGSAVVVDAQTGGIVRLTTGAVNGNTEYIDWGDIRSLHVDQKVTMEVRAKLNSSSNISGQLRLSFDGNNRIYFYSAATWYIVCRNGGVSSSADSGVAIDTDYHIFRIECHTHGSNHVHFYIDGTETANSPITTNIPDDAADYLQPYIWVQTQEDDTKSMDVDYVVMRQEI